jgi:hypothetical protein
VKFATSVRIALAFVLASSLLAFPGSDKKDKEKSAPAQIVDSGSFSISVKGQKVAAETFTIEQRNGSSIIKSQFRETDGSDPAQKSALEMTANGELLRYEWSQASGASVTVLPKNDFLIENINSAGSGKPSEQPFLMPSTSAILDNNFFVHREVLAWRYLAAACKQESGSFKCQQTPADFGVLVPQDHTSMHVRLELAGKEKVKVRGADRELLRLNLTTDDVAWALFVDDSDHFKLVRVDIPADNTEVVRD